MQINKDGTLGMWARMDIEVLQEFGWNVEDMATAIRELRDENLELQKLIEELEEKNEKA